MNDPTLNIIKSLPSSIQNISIYSNHAASRKIFLVFCVIVQMGHDQAKYHVVFITSIFYPFQSNLIIKSWSLNGSAKVWVAIFAILKPRQKVYSQVFDSHISIILNIAFHKFSGSVLLYLNPVEKHSLFVPVYDIFQGNIRAFDLFARIYRLHIHPKRIIINSQSHSFTLEIVRPPLVIMRPFRGMLGSIPILCESKVITPSINTNHIKAKTFQILINPIDIVEPCCLGYVSILCFFICFIEVLVGRPIKWRFLGIKSFEIHLCYNLSIWQLLQWYNLMRKLKKLQRREYNLKNRSYKVFCSQFQVFQKE